MKVFTNQHMPDNIRNAVLDVTDGGYPNDIFIWWNLLDNMPIRKDYDNEEDYNLEVEWWGSSGGSQSWVVTQWLLTQGCKLGDDVLVEYSW